MKVINEISSSSCIFHPANNDPAALVEAVRSLAAAGSKYVELASHLSDGDPQGVLKEIKNIDIKVWSVHGYLGMDAISPDRAVRDRAVEAAYRHAAAFAEFTPCPLVEHYLDRHNDRNVAHYFHDSIEKLYNKVSALGMIMCVETAPYKPLEYERHPDSREIADFVRSFDSEYMQLTLDINHSNLAETIEEAAANCRGVITNIHVSNNYGQKEQHLPPDDGIIDIKAAFEALRANGYTGPCNMEFSFPGDRCPTVEKVRDARIYMEKLLGF